MKWPKVHKFGIPGYKSIKRIFKSQKQTCCGDHSTIYTNIELLCFISEANIMLYVSCTSKISK